MSVLICRVVSGGQCGRERGKIGLKSWQLARLVSHPTGREKSERVVAGEKKKTTDVFGIPTYFVHIDVANWQMAVLRFI